MAHVFMLTMISFYFHVSASCSNLISEGSYFVEVAEDGDDGNSRNVNSKPATADFHKCSLTPDCNFLFMDIETNEFTQVSSESDLPEERHDYKIWKKIPPEERTYKSCQSAQSIGFNHDDVIKINLANGTTKDVYCDMRTEGGGWMVILRRVSNATSFNRTWQEYVDGFGDPRHNFWLGLEAIHILTKNKNVTLRVELKDINGTTGYAHYVDFSLSGKDAKYALNVGNYNGNLGDSMTGSNGCAFTTWDQDNDVNNDVNMAIWRGGPWWYKAASTARLMSLFPWETKTKTLTMKWITWRSIGDIIFAEMKIRFADEI